MGIGAVTLGLGAISGGSEKQTDISGEGGFPEEAIMAKMRAASDSQQAYQAQISNAQANAYPNGQYDGVLNQQQYVPDQQQYANQMVWRNPNYTTGITPNYYERLMWESEMQRLKEVERELALQRAVRTLRTLETIPTRPFFTDGAGLATKAPDPEPRVPAVNSDPLTEEPRLVTI